mmetsp:Transcript_41009/g.34555  ORF Transcript_41009/g.34555 Transcript_41009/m.34555 type:complete len:105 (+) Transcript_41009:201-515(+)
MCVCVMLGGDVCGCVGVIVHADKIHIRSKEPYIRSKESYIIRSIMTSFHLCGSVANWTRTLFVREGGLSLFRKCRHAFFLISGCKCCPERSELALQPLLQSHFI